MICEQIGKVYDNDRVTVAKLQGDRYLVTVAKFAGWNRVGKLGKQRSECIVSKFGKGLHEPLAKQIVCSTTQLIVSRIEEIGLWREAERLALSPSCAIVVLSSYVVRDESSFGLGFVHDFVTALVG